MGVVITNILLSLTSISEFAYLWTVFIGEIVPSFPYAYATHVGASLYASEEGRRDPVMLTVSFITLAATVANAWKVGVLAKAALQERAFHGDACDAAYDQLR